ncbi:hypothetical protein [Haloarcula marina]|uniref:hypothetical protein n=1 Tax=Haloarcula marina TaxID=2961574 RepID=UPI0020B6620F|nr:hypothetical protein [Halomicroarcula marina]
MARYSANLSEVKGSEAYILEIAFDGGKHPLTSLGLEDIGVEMGRDQLYVRTGDVAGMQEVISKLEEHIDMGRLPVLLLLSERPSEAESAAVVYCDGVDSETEARELVREIVQKLHDPEFMDSHSSWEERVKKLPSALSISGSAITVIEFLPF